MFNNKYYNPPILHIKISIKINLSLTKTISSKYINNLNTQINHPIHNHIFYPKLNINQLLINNIINPNRIISNPILLIYKLIKKYKMILKKLFNSSKINIHISISKFLFKCSMINVSPNKIFPNPLIYKITNNPKKILSFKILHNLWREQICKLSKKCIVMRKYLFNMDMESISPENMLKKVKLCNFIIIT